MIALFGQVSLYLALVFAVLQSVLPLFGYYGSRGQAAGRRQLSNYAYPYLLAFARPAALGQFAFVSGAYILLTIAFANSDFSIAYVAANSHPALPLMYRLTALWGAHEGSILLWIMMLNVWTVAYAYLEKNSTQQSLTLAVLGLISLCFLSFLIFTSNPFLPALVPMHGQDLNPLLQDPGFVIHPPMLYTGYVGFSVAFAMTQAALLNGKLDNAWAHTTRQFALAAWCFLTFGIALGSWWAYRVLGWGGFWFWDPVENASLLPWLAGTALIHVLVLVEKRDAGKKWAVLLSIICFALSLLGTFLVRSGVLISAHTFANDPARGVFLLILLAIILTAALVVYVVRTPHIATSQKLFFSASSREMALLINSILLFIAMLTILLGTLYPLILDALHLGMISVGAPYFNSVMLPLIFLIMIFMGFAAFCHWQTQTFKELFSQTWKKILSSIFLAILLLYCFVGHLDATAVISLSLSFWIIQSILGCFRLLPAMSFAHLGFAVLIIGIMLSSILNQEKEVRIKVGDSVNIGPYQFFFIDTAGVRGSNYRGIQGTFEVIKNTHHVTNLYPEKRIYLVRDMVMTKVDIHPGLFRDLYIALGEPLDQNYWSVRIYYKPFIRWIWLGGILMIIGGIFAILPRRSRF